MNRTYRIATRKSPLALWQAEYVKARLEQAQPGIHVELLLLTTQGDKHLDTPLAKIGGKGLFVKELEQALLDKRADMAVHSMKDVPMEVPPGLRLHTALEREDPSDAFISTQYASLLELPQGAVVGTSSLRRRCQLHYARPDLQLRDCRGNVNTRLAKLDQGEYDALILASAGLMRLDLAERIRARLPQSLSLPACGQGALGIETRESCQELMPLLQALTHRPTVLCVAAERALNRRLEGGCQVPIAGFATLSGNQLSLEGRVGSEDGHQLLISRHSQKLILDEPAANSHPSQVQEAEIALAESLGQKVAEDLFDQGAQALLAPLFER